MVMASRFHRVLQRLSSSARPVCARVDSDTLPYNLAVPHRTGGSLATVRAIAGGYLGAIWRRFYYRSEEPAMLLLLLCAAGQTCRGPVCASVCLYVAEWTAYAFL